MQDTLVTSDEPISTVNVLWFVEPGVRVTVDAPSVMMRRSQV